MTSALNPEAAEFLIETPRLVLRVLTPNDLNPLAEMNSDPEVMQHFPRLQTRDETAAFIEKQIASQERWGFSLWAVVRRADRKLLGFVGLNQVQVPNPLAPGVEVGWRLARDEWHQGYAFEAAHAVLAYGLEVLNLAEIVTFTAPENERSQALMRRLDLTRCPDRDFEHPAVPAGHRLRWHVVYAADSSWIGRQSQSACA